MPDAWEYPWFAAWDLAFHCVPLALVDPDFAKAPAAAADPRVVHAPERPAAGLRVGLLATSTRRSTPGRPGASTRSIGGSAARADRDFLERVFHKLLLNFTWWVNRKDAEGHNVFQGGFLGLDNIGVFDRSSAAARRRPPRPGRRHGLDGLLLASTCWRSRSSWRATTPSTRTSRPSSSSTSCTSPGRSTTSAASGIPLWDDEDGFFYDVLHLDRTSTMPLKVRSPGRAHPAAGRRDDRAGRCSSACPGSSAGWTGSSKTGPTSPALVSRWEEPGVGERRLLALVRGHRMKAAARPDARPRRVPVRPRHPRPQPRSTASTPTCWTWRAAARVDYEPAESRTGALRRQLQLARAGLVPDQLPAHRGAPEVRPLLRRRLHGRACRPVGDQLASIGEVADDLGRRLESLFLRDADGRRPVAARTTAIETEGRTGATSCCCSTNTSTATPARGLGASHQTGWTALVAKLLEQRPAAARGQRCRPGRDRWSGRHGSVALRHVPTEPTADPSTPTDRIAIVHDYFTQRGGAERLVGDLARLLPAASIHTSVYDPGSLPEALRSVRIRTTPLQRLRRGGVPLELLAPLLPGVRPAARSAAPRSSSRAHRVRPSRRPPASAVHVAYCHSPPQFLWGSDEYFHGRIRGRALSPAARRPAPRRSRRRRGASTSTSRTRHTRRTASAMPTIVRPRSSTRRSRPAPSRRIRSGRAGSWSSPGSDGTSGSTSPSKPRRRTAGRSTSSARDRTRRRCAAPPVRWSDSWGACRTMRSPGRWPGASR